MALERPTIAGPRERYVFYPNGAPVPFAAAPKIYNRPFSIRFPLSSVQKG